MPPAAAVDVTEVEKPNTVSPLLIQPHRAVKRDSTAVCDVFWNIITITVFYILILTLKLWAYIKMILAETNNIY